MLSTVGDAALIRLLVIEDNEKRIGLFKQWMPPDIQATYVRSAGRAVRVIKLDEGTIYAGICLDHDLNDQIVAEEERGINGVEVVRRLIEHTSRDVPILVHSMNFSGGTSMFRMLEAQGFTVTRIPFKHLHKKVFLGWIDDVRAEWDLSHDSGDGH